jgi:hypothetical protein
MVDLPDIGCAVTSNAREKSAWRLSLEKFSLSNDSCAKLKKARKEHTMIIALAGRRVDALDAKLARFPSTPENLETVHKRILELLQAKRASTLVSSAACGADLLALSAAQSLGVRRIIVLPFEREKFRKTSVTDRPGEWGSLYDGIVDEVQKAGDLQTLHLRSEEEAYAEATHVIVDEAISLGQKLRVPVVAVLVWDGKSRGKGDLTEEFGRYAKSKKVAVIEVMTV